MIVNKIKEIFMKKVLIMLLLFLSIGCGRQEPKKMNNELNENVNIVTINNEIFNLKSSASLKSMHYKENYVDFRTDAVGNIRIMRYQKSDDFFFEIRLTFEENHTYDEVKKLLNQYQEKQKVINGVNYAYYEYKNDVGNDVHYYLCKYNNIAYSIIFFLGDNPGNIEEVFMNNVTFE